MSFWEYDAERHLKVEKQDSYDEGFQEGIGLGRKQGIESEKINTLREMERADAAEKELFALKEELQRLREELVKG